MAIRTNPLPGAFLFFWLFLTFEVSRTENAPRLVSRNYQKMTYFWDLIRVREGSDLMGQKMSLASHS